MYKKIISTSVVVAIAIMLGIAVSSQDNQVVKADTPKSSLKPLVIETADEPYITIYYTEQDVIDIAKVLYNECRGVGSKTEQACVAWTVLNRADNQGISIAEVIRAENQFAFSENTIIDGTLLDLASDVLWRWNMEKNGETEVGRVLPQDYTYFAGRNGHNYFRNGFSDNYSIWDYSLESPYEN